MSSAHVLLFAFLIGCVCGLRSMTAPAVTAWAAHLGWIRLGGSILSFLSHPVSVGIFSLFALGELIADKLAFIPGRTTPGPLIVRIIFGALCGAALATAAGAGVLAGAIPGGVGAVLGAFAGYTYRRKLSSGKRGTDLLLALLEDAVAVGGGLLVVSHL